ncbi:MAG: phosphotransferase [Clostridia bacterium]|nr:phosphotransferase [Clostridia bacterium]
MALTDFELKEILTSFGITPVAITPCSIGLINATYFVDTSDRRYVLQRINTAVFSDPRGVMDNIASVTAHLREKGISTLTFLPADDGNCYLENEHGFFRLSLCLDGKTYNEATPELLEKAAEAFGEFQYALTDFDASLLKETIPDFHNTPVRTEALWEAVAIAPNERIAAAVDAIQQAKQFSSQASYIMSLLSRGDLPLRVVHNDTKVNNVLLAEDGTATVLDLDTVMPGSLLFDFGDAIRSGASTKPEGDGDIEGFAIDKERYEAFLRGFLKGIRGALTPNEQKLLPFGAFVLAYELGVRFLTDYLRGDVYFRTSYPEENLIRAKGQLALAKNIFFRLDELSALTKKYI